MDALVHHNFVLLVVIPVQHVVVDLETVTKQMVAKLTLIMITIIVMVVESYVHPRINVQEDLVLQYLLQHAMAVLVVPYLLELTLVHVLNIMV